MLNENKLFLEWQEALQDIPEYAEELKQIENDQDEIIDRFYTALNFGTAGLRGIMGLGINRMNKFTVGQATQGLASYALTKLNAPSFAIGYDSRINSKVFAEHAASILAANGIEVHIYPELAPTPALAFAVRELGCDFGIVVTASHNPSQYNGYKVFGNDGCQIDDDIAADIFSEIQKTDIFEGVKTIPFEAALAEDKIVYISDDIPKKYIDVVLTQALKPEVCAEADIDIIYTPLHGTGNLYVREALRRMNVKNVTVVKEQELPDGNFPTAPYPNPEFPEALELGMKLSKERDADLLIATDPDADRVAIVVKHDGELVRITGNELGVLLLDYIAKTRKELDTMPDNPVAVRSIVSTKLTDKVAAAYGVSVRDVLTGFKFVGEVIGQLEAKGEIERFIFGFEEACGYLIGTHVRDKDAVVTSVLVAEMISSLKLEDKTAVDRLEEIYKAYGYYSNMTQNLVFEGAEGMDKMKSIMDNLRHNPPESIVGRDVEVYLDYWTSIKYQDGDKFDIDTRPANVLEYRLSDDCGIIIRPSGTEPKLKIYYSLVSDSKEKVLELEKEYSRASVELAGVEA